MNDRSRLVTPAWCWGLSGLRDFFFLVRDNLGEVRDVKIFKEGLG